ncbi:hypothetical protein J5N97_022494 [Dioscorea zingiberensis]|uniref:Uncharacterized protein n=1 Tax=Dioscorea zingiberensis TaxID=325984 RepID=A0A9D5HAW1_9LILI|nr:hypothetical protein J5N97_022494 [Dioscorea zingiberensis]
METTLLSPVDAEAWQGGNGSLASLAIIGISLATVLFSSDGDIILSGKWRLATMRLVLIWCCGLCSDPNLYPSEGPSDIGSRPCLAEDERRRTSPFSNSYRGLVERCWRRA